MVRRLVVLALFWLNAAGILFAQKGADPTQRYFRLICLVHLTGSGQAGDERMPEFVKEGTEVARVAQEAAAVAATAAAASRQLPEPGAKATGTVRSPEQQAADAARATTARPGILAWSMLRSDDGNMAIIQVVAADRHAFDAILADKRSELRVFEIGKDSPDSIQSELRKYRKDFDLQNFQVVAQ